MARFLACLLVSELLSAGPRHGWTPEVVRLNVISDALIGIAYCCLGGALIYLGSRKKDFAYYGLFLMLGAFTLAGGITHWLQVWTVWNPLYHLQGAVKLITALLSIATAAVFIVLVPKIRALPSRAQLKAMYQALEGKVAERKQIEEEPEQRVNEQTAELKRSSEELQQFAYVASHDLQEPLRMIPTFSQLLAHRYKGRPDPDADEIIDLAAEGVRRMRDLIHDLLAYSRVVSAQAETFQRTSCETVLSGAVNNLRVAVEENQAVITHDPLPELVADEMQLIQLFQNLISNALKYRSPEPPRIHVSAERRGNEWLFSVREQWHWH